MEFESQTINLAGLHETIHEGGNPHQRRLIVMKTKQYSKSWPFLKPVSKSEAPNYSDVIKTPMDLSLLERNVNDDKYETMYLFEHDLRLIFLNCYAFNG
jgi:histone acetyltransferase